MNQLKQIYYEGKETTYFISEDGQLYNQKTDTWYKGRVSENGYLDYIIKINNQQKTFRAHRLVAEYFLEHKEGCDIVNHKDGNKLNNHYSNLEWVTQAENVQHAYDNLEHKKVYTILEYDKNLPGEIWKPSHFNKVYQISNYGRVLNTSTNRILTGKRDTGYVRYELRGEEGQRKTFLGHRLVYKAFNPEFDIDNRRIVINHINGDKLDNRLENLEETSISENIKHAYQTGLNSKTRAVSQYDLQMNFIKEYPSANEAARQLGIRQSLITAACQREGTSHGFNWRYSDQKDAQRL